MDASPLSRRAFASSTAAYVASSIFLGYAPVARADPARGRCRSPAAAERQPAPAAAERPLFDPGSIARLEQERERYAAIVERGGWERLPERLRLRAGQRTARVRLLRRRLAAEGYLPAAAETGACYDDAVDTAVTAFQAAHDLPHRGRVDHRTVAAMNVPAHIRLRAIDASLERVRRPLFARLRMDSRYLIVNLAAESAQVIDGSRVVVSSRVVIGRPERPSKELVTHVTAVKFAPKWRVPRSIALKEIVPQIIAEEGWLAAHHMRLVAPDHRVIDVTTDDWQGKAFTIEQEPGPHNALGLLKIEMPNPYKMYLHDTPDKALFHRRRRAASHGCVRLEEPARFAAAILETVDRSWTPETVATQMRARGTGWDATRAVPLGAAHAIPVAWLYLTAWTSDDGVTHFADDIYRLDA